jgi:cytochrome c biogenesis protein
VTDTLTDSAALEALSTAPTPPTVGARTVRSAWRQLTSMRTALLLLSLLALAAVPGTVLPQRGLNPVKVDDFFRAHPHLAPFLDRLSLFDVFAAPWFAAIYLLLFISLAGCLVPRIRMHTRALRRRPPAAPRHLRRLGTSAQWTSSESPDAIVDTVGAVLRRRHWRTDVCREADGTISIAAEKGYLRETGNLVFHVSLVLLLVGIAAGGLFGYKGTVLVVQGGGFSDIRSSYDVFQPARLFSESALPPFAFTLDTFRATYQPTGEPRSFDAHIAYQASPDAQTRSYDVTPNHPLSIAGADVYLVGHGYAPRISVRDAHGHLVYDKSTPFLPDDAMFTSHGVVKVPAGLPRQLGFTGFFYPTFGASAFGAQSTYPAPTDPVLSLAAWQGNLGLDGAGAPQSVYSLPVANLRSVGTHQLSPGQSWRLADGTTVTFGGIDQWATFQIAHDPGTRLVLFAAVFIVGGLLVSLRVRRRRFWVRAAPAQASGDARRTVVQAGGLARGDTEGFTAEFGSLLQLMKD